jgi:hypothetical protein
MSDSTITALMEQIRETIKLSSNGSLPGSKARDAYKKLARQYNLLEQKYVSSHSRGFIKGLLYHHNSQNSANLTALLLMRKGKPVPVAFAGDRLLLAALPELVAKEYASLPDDGAARVRLGDRAGQSFSMVVKKMALPGESIIVAAVTSTPLFDTAHFEHLALLLRSIVERNLELRSPIMMIYINNIATEISSVFKSLEGGSLHVDHFLLKIPRGSFLYAGIFTLIEYSNAIVAILKSKYPDSVHIFALSLSSYLVIYGDEIKNGLELKRNRINFEFHGNNIPYKVDLSEIDSPQSLYIYLEKL